VGHAVRIGDHDVPLGEVGGCPFYLDGRQYQFWTQSQLIRDVGPGAPEGYARPPGDDAPFIG